jgi:ABC-type protease/lipase transport system fused ATPase/permease subunit
MFALFDSPWAPVYLAVIYLMHPLLGAIATSGALLMLGLAVIGNLITKVGLREGGKLQMRNMQRVDAFNRNAEVIDAMGVFPALCRRWLATTREAIDFTERASDRVGYISALTKTCASFCRS